MKVNQCEMCVCVSVCFRAWQTGLGKQVNYETTKTIYHVKVAYRTGER